MNDRLKSLGSEQIAPFIILALGTSLRVKLLNEEKLEKARTAGPGPVIYTFWHECMLGLTYTHRKKGICILISRHRDGEYIARATLRLGFTSARGSSSAAGAAGIAGMVRAAERGHDLAVTPDGPKGPRHVVKAGVIHLASRTGVPIMPMSVEATRGIRLKSWDRFLIPLPFSKFVVGYADHIEVPRELAKEDVEEYSVTLAERLMSLDELLKKECGK